jgi:hypothetical protein
MSDPTKSESGLDANEVLGARLYAIDSLMIVVITMLAARPEFRASIDSLIRTMQNAPPPIDSEKGRAYMQVVLDQLRYYQEIAQGSESAPKGRAQ